MSRIHPITRHRWSEPDDAALREAVEVVYGDEDDERSPKVSSWSAVAGRLLPDVIVTPAACRARHAWLREEEQRLERVRIDAEARADEAQREALDAADRQEARTARTAVDEDSWDKLEGMINEYERTEQEELAGFLSGVLDRLGAIEAAVARLEAMWTPEVLLP